MAARSKVRFLATDIFDMPDAEDGKRYEVIDGALIMTPAPGWTHQRPLMRLNHVLLNWVYSLGEVITAPFGVILNDENGVEPDIIFVSRQNEHLIKERGIEGSPDLFVEVLSPSTSARDRGVKMRSYAAAGSVPHYWIMDPVAQAIEAYRLGESGYELAADCTTGETFKPEVFPGLEIPIDAICS